MEAVTELLKNLKKLNFQEIEKKVLKKRSDELISLNKKQLEIGEDSDGLKLPGYASISYLRYKTNIGSKSGDHYDLKVTGDFWNAFILKQKGSDSFIDSTDSKRDDIVNTLTGDHIFGIQDNNLTKAENDFLIEDTEKEVLQSLQL